MRTFLISLVLLIAHQSVAQAAEPIGRDLHGRAVELTDGVNPRALVFWTLDCSDCLAPVKALQEGGLDVLLVNVDGAASRSALSTFLHRQGIVAPVLPDPTTTLQQRFGLTGQGVVLLDASGAITQRQSGPRFDAVALLASVGLDTTTLASVDH